MHRNPVEFPSDENGGLLRGMHPAGDDPTAPRIVSFSVLFEAEANADAYAAEMREAAFEVHVDECLEMFDVRAWKVVASAYIVPTYDRITALVDLISGIATSHAGYPDGWDAEPRPGIGMEAQRA